MNGGILIGGGGHADDIWATLNHKLPGIYPWHRVDHHKDWFPVGGETVIGINDPQVRARVLGELPILQDSYWFHPWASVSETTVGPGTHVNAGVTCTRSRLGHHTTICPGVTICGDVTIGNRVMVGAGATIINMLTIGDDAVIGAGAVVLSDIGPGETWVGNPARRIK